MFRRVVLLVVAAGLGGVLVYGPRLFRDKEAERLRAENERLQRERRELEQVVDRLSGERRVAQVLVAEQTRNPDGSIRETVIKFQEIDRQDRPLPTRTFAVPGQVIHFEALVIKFEQEYVKRGDPLRGKSIALFRRIYGDTQAPEDGFWLDRKDAVPDIFRIAEHPTTFEQGLWREFWEYATNPAKARQAGVRVAQGQAVLNPMQAGEFWILTLESDGGLNLIKKELDPLLQEHLLEVTRPKR